MVRRMIIVRLLIIVLATLFLPACRKHHKKMSQESCPAQEQPGKRLGVLNSPLPHVPGERVV